MKIRSIAAALALAAAPGLLAAQQTQPAQAHARHQGQRGEHRGGIQALIARRDQLHLSADQVSRLQAIQQRLESQDRPLQERMRTLFQQSGLPDFRARRAERGAQGQPRAQRPQLTEQQRQQLKQLREQAKPIREQMRQNRQAALREVQGVLTAEQKQQVQQWRQQHQQRRGEHGHGRRGQGQHGARGQQG
jgi:predicted transglutaminase-like cysteine proteinase